MEFRYKAITDRGERVTGVHYARTAALARKELSSRFSSILEFSEVSAGERSRLHQPFKVPAQSVAIFFRQMATMLGSGVP